MPCLIDVDVKDSVRSAWSIIHALACHLAVHQTGINYVHCLLQAFYGHLNKVTYKNFILLLSNTHILWLWIQQIWNLLKINLEKAYVDLPVWNKILILQFIKRAEDEF